MENEQPVNENNINEQAQPNTANTNTSLEGPSQDDRTFAALLHALGIVGSFIAPLIIWIMKKDDSPFVDQHGKAALNFHISYFIWYVISGILTLLFIGIFMIIILGVLQLVFMIIAAINASNGQHYEYPLTIRFIN